MDNLCRLIDKKTTTIEQTSTLSMHTVTMYHDFRPKQLSVEVVLQKDVLHALYWNPHP